MKTITEFINESIITESNSSLEKVLSKDFAGQVFRDVQVEKEFEKNDYAILLLPAIDEFINKCDVYAQGTNWILVNCDAQADIDELSCDHPEIEGVVPMDNPGQGLKISDARSAWGKLDDKLKDKLIKAINQDY